MKKHTQSDAGAKCHSQTNLHALSHTIELSGTKVLSGKGGHRHTEGIHDHPEYGINLRICGICRHRITSEKIDIGLNDDIGNVIHNRLKPRRNTDLNDTNEQHLVEAHFTPLQAVTLLGAHQTKRNEHGTNKLRKNCRNSDSLYGHTKHYDK